jgi:hypothetical protein
MCPHIKFFTLLHISRYKYLFANVNISSRIHAKVNLEISHNKLLIKLIVKNVTYCMDPIPFFVFKVPWSFSFIRGGLLMLD